MKSFYLLFIANLFLWNTSALSQEKLEIEGAIIISNSEDASPAPGTLRWTGTDFEGWNGLFWVSITGNKTIGSVIDIDGNIYKTVKIGDQEWMA